MGTRSKAPAARGENESAENVKPAPLMLSESVTMAELFISGPESCTGADAVAVVCPGIGIWVALSV